MKQLFRYLTIFTFFIASTIFIHTVKAPQRIPLHGLRIACMSEKDAIRTNADKHLIPYAQLAHTNAEKQRCYFRFSPRDVICIPKSIATHKQSACPQFPTIDGTPEKFCYILNKKYVPLSEELKKKQPVSASIYMSPKHGVVKTWQEVRDILLGTNKNK